MISKEQIELNVCTGYIEYVRELFPVEIEESRRYIHVLKIREWQLKRRLLKLHRVEDLATLRHGHHEAERFYFDFIDETSTDAVEREICEILQLIAVEFHVEIVQIEAMHPERRAEFARDKETIRLMWNHYVEQAQELKVYEAEHEQTN